MTAEISDLFDVILNINETYSRSASILLTFDNFLIENMYTYNCNFEQEHSSLSSVAAAVATTTTTAASLGRFIDFSGKISWLYACTFNLRAVHVIAIYSR